jgi:hypothetical protein
MRNKHFCHLVDLNLDRFLGWFPSYEAAEFIRELYLANCINPADREVIIVDGSCYTGRFVPF